MSMKAAYSGLRSEKNVFARSSTSSGEADVRNSCSVRSEGAMSPGLPRRNEREFYLKSRPFAPFRRQGDVPAQDAGETARYRQPQPRPSVLPGSGPVLLPELIEDEPLSRLGNPDPCVSDAIVHAAPPHADADAHLALLGELERIAQQHTHQARRLAQVASHLRQVP